MRIRTIKPEFWTSLTVAKLTASEKLCFIGLWNYADDDGRGVDDPRLIAAAVFALDDAIGPREVGLIMDDIAECGLILRYEVDGLRYFAVTGWGEHQVISRPRPSRLPEPSVSIHGGLTEPSRSHPELVCEDSTLEGKGREGKGTGKGREGKNFLKTAIEKEANPLQPTPDELYLARKLSDTITPGVIVNLHKRYGVSEVCEVLRSVADFGGNPTDWVAYVTGILTDRAAMA